ncbi:hypothetical protein V6N11_002097 [Hibiscus sabdariffa]|uniref:Uncharacterized protein n=1 Tax=Hibiscus sabdariffa TaxID=183260 RepID=A0ABR2QUT5_9ROSI
MDLTQIARPKAQPHGQVLRTSTDALDGLSSLPQFPLALLSIAAIVAEFAKQNSWPVLVPELRYAIQSNNAVSNGANSEWSTINALTVLHALVRPFQYLLNPKVAKEPVPPQLELIAKEILAPLLTVFHHLVEKCTSEYDYLLTLKTGKRALQIFCSLTTRHRKYCDKLMPDIINFVMKIVKFSSNVSKLDFLSERIVFLAFDVISHILETGPGWRIVSPHFSFLLESSILAALMLNEKDISEWEEDPEEYTWKNLPYELEEISGRRENLFTARKNAINLLGVVSMSKVGAR